MLLQATISRAISRHRVISQVVDLNSVVAMEEEEEEVSSFPSTCS